MSADKQVVQCPSCHAVYPVPARLAGRRFRCRRCGAVMQHRLPAQEDGDAAPRPDERAPSPKVAPGSGSACLVADSARRASGRPLSALEKALGLPKPYLIAFLVTLLIVGPCVVVVWLTDRGQRQRAHHYYPRPSSLARELATINGSGGDDEKAAEFDRLLSSLEGKCVEDREQIARSCVRLYRQARAHGMKGSTEDGLLKTMRGMNLAIPDGAPGPD